MHLVFIENGKGISQMYPKSYMGKCNFTLNKRYANEIDHNSASNEYF